ncbi:uncharacterized protein LOC125668105 [Ostrea edulis]|uniref:uncharacterized protein LOC125668105 n=1 Tax=Ostrea edulis TaxID=37623 RepID=UPI0024AFCF00|nr:uncharacterized protein LOC125668105 [Ostrea edulis]
MKRERSEKKSKAVSKMPCIEATVNNKCQWYEVLLELHLKSTFRLTGAINKSDNRRELPTIPQPTHTMEWLARTSFKHRPLRHNIVPQQRKHKTPKRHTQHDHSKFVY